MANKTIIIVREPNVDVPEAYLRKVLAACPSGGGYAIQSTHKDGHSELITDNMDTAVQLSDVQDLLKSAASHRILLAFNKLEKVDVKFLQPFHVAIDGDDVLLSFGIDGHFPTMVEAGTTEESLLAHRVMFPNIQQLIKLSGGDLDRFIAELRGPIFTEMAMSRIGDRGAYCFFPPEGEPIWLGKNKAGSVFPWGQTSDTLGYTEVPATVATAAAAGKKKGWWGVGKGPEVPVAQVPVTKATTEPAAPPPVLLNLPADKPDTKINPPAATPAEAAPPPSTPPKGEWAKIPQGLSKDQRKKMIRRVTNCGSVLPDDWNKDPFWYWVAEYPKDEKLVQLAKANAGEPKDMRSKEPPKAVSPSRGSEVDVLMMSKEERDGIETHILNVLGYNAKHITMPIEIQKMESVYPPFSKEFGLDFETMNGWTPKQLRLLGSKGLIHYALEARRKLIELKSAGSTSVEDAAPAATSSAASATPSKGVWGKRKTA